MSKEKKETMKLSKKQLITLLVAALIVVILAVVGLRKVIFPADSWLYNVYEEEQASKVLVRLFKSAILLLVCFDVMKLGDIISGLNNKTQNNTAKTILLLVGNVIKYAVIIVVILKALSVWGVDTTAIVTGAGILTLVIGLGCQTLVSDIVSGIFMLFEGDIKVGDIVVINGWRGTVEQIGLRRTRIVDTVGNVNSVNNSSVSNIINNTKQLSYAICDVGIEYNESIERVEKILKDNFPQIKKDIPAIVEGPFYKGVAELGNSAVVIRLLATCKEEDKFQTERDLNRAIKLIFDKNNVNIPFDQIVVNYREEEKSVDVTAKDKKEAKEFNEEQKELSKGMDKDN